MLLSEAAGLPAALSTERAAALLDCARGTLWAQARDNGGIVDTEGNIVVRPFYIGRALRWPRDQILTLLRPIEPDGAGLAPLSTSAAERSLPEDPSGGPTRQHPAGEPGTVHDRQHDQVTRDGTGAV